MSEEEIISSVRRRERVWIRKTMERTLLDCDCVKEKDVGGRCEGQEAKV